MAGYRGFSMSNNAVSAYCHGQKPISKWTKKAILEEVADLKPTHEVMEMLKSLSTYVLREVLLECTEWHHSSKYYNCIDFYGIREEFFEEDADLDVLMEEIEEAKNNEIAKKERAKKEALLPVETYYAVIKYGTWVGTRNHPHLVHTEEVATVIGNWAQTSAGRKKVDGKYFEIIAKISRYKYYKLRKIYTAQQEKKREAARKRRVPIF